MEGLVEKFGWKKVAGVLVVGSLIAFIYIIFSMMQINGTQKGSQNSQKPSPGSGSSNGSGGFGSSNPGNNGSSSNGDNGSPNSNTPSNFRKIDAKKFSISYPSNFQASESNDPTTNIDTVSLLGQNKVNIFIKFYPNSTPASDILGPFRELGFEEQNYQYNNFLGKTLTGKFGTNPVRQQKLIFFSGEKNNQGIIVSAFLDYPSQVVNPEIENQFQQIVQSFEF